MINLFVRLIYSLAYPLAPGNSVPPVDYTPVLSSAGKPDRTDNFTRAVFSEAVIELSPILVEKTTV